MQKKDESRAEDPLALDPTSPPLENREKLQTVLDAVNQMNPKNPTPFNPKPFIDIGKGAADEWKHVQDSVPDHRYDKDLIPADNWESWGR